MAYWVDSQGRIREGDEDQGRRLGYRPATEEDINAHNHALDLDAADTKGIGGRIAEGFERGLGEIQDMARSSGWTPPLPGSEAFGTGGGLPAPPEAPAPLPPAGAETFPEAFSPEARLRAERHPYSTGFGTGLAVAPFAGIAGAAGGALAPAAVPLVGGAIGAIGAEAGVEAVAQEYDDAWLEQRPFELKRAAGNLALFGLGDLLFRGGAKVVGKAFTPKPEASAVRGARNVVAEAQAKAQKAGAHPTRSVGAASAEELNDPFDAAISQMDEASAYTLARDADDHAWLVARDIADEMTRLDEGLSESLGSNIKYRDFEIAADAWDGSTLERQAEWMQQAEDMGSAVIEAIEQSPVDLGNHGKRAAADIRSGWQNIAAAESPARRIYLLDQLKKSMQQRVKSIARDRNADQVARADLLQILDEYAGGQNTRGFLLEGLENPELFGHAADLQKALNSPWHSMLKSWNKVQNLLLEATGETKFGVMGPGANVMEGTANRARALIDQDPRALSEIRQHLGNVFDGYQRLIEARQAHGIVEKEGLPQLEQSIRNLMEDWNLGQTIGVARAKAAHIKRNPRHWQRVLDAAEGAPGIGGFLKSARQLQQMAGDLHIPKGTALAEVWDAGLRRYAKHPNLTDPATQHAYSSWMRDAIRARGAPIPGPPGGSGGLGQVAKEAGTKVAGAGLFGLGAAATQQPQQTDENGQPVAQAGAGPAGLMGLGLALLFKGKPRATFWHKASVHGKAIPAGARAAADAIIRQEMEAIQRAAAGARQLPSSKAVAAELEAINDRLAARAIAEAPGADPEQVAEYVKNTVTAEFAGHAPRGGEAIKGRVSAVLGDVEDGGAALLPRLAQRFADKHEEIRDAYNDVAVRMAEAQMPRFVEALNHGLREGWGAHNHKTGGPGYDMFRLKLRDPHAAPDWDFDKRIEAYLEDAEMYALDEINPWLKRQGKPPLESLDETSREYLRAALMSDASELVQDAEADAAGLNWRAGLGIRVRDMASLRNGTIDWREIAQMSRDEAVGTIAAQAAYWNIPPSLRRPIAEDIMDAVAAGATPEEAGIGLSRVFNDGAELEPLGEKSHEAAAAVFENWANREGSEELGFNIIRAINDYAGDLDYRHINSFVRGSGVNPDRDPAKIQQMALRLQTALDYAVDKGYAAPGTTWRGVLFNNADLARLDASDVAEAHSFMSTSADKDYAMKIIAGKVQKKQKPDLHEVLLEVVQKTGAPINPSEHEVLLRAGTRFRKEPPTPGSGARWRLVELDTPPKVPATIARPSALPWVAGGVFTLGSLTAADKAHAGEGEPSSPPDPRGRERPVGPSPEAGPATLYRDAVRGIDEGGANLLRQQASAALRRTPPVGRTPLRAFTGRRDLDAAVDDARATLAELQGDPSALIETLAQNLGDLPRTHPSVYMALTEKAVGIIGYLSAQVPERTGQTLLDPVGTAPSVDRSLEFAYKVVGATNPRQAMADIARLDIPPEELEAFQLNWAEIWEPFKAELVGQTMRRAEGGRPVDAEKLRQLDAILGMNGALDPSGSVEVAQHMLAAQEQAPAAPASNSAPSQAPSRTGRASGMLRTKLATIEQENLVG
jgi:hypothetical protein